MVEFGADRGGGEKARRAAGKGSSNEIGGGDGRRGVGPTPETRSAGRVGIAVGSDKAATDGSAGVAEAAVGGEGAVLRSALLLASRIRAIEGGGSMAGETGRDAVVATGERAGDEAEAGVPFAAAARFCA